MIILTIYVSNLRRTFPKLILIRQVQRLERNLGEITSDTLKNQSAVQYLLDLSVALDYSAYSSRK